MKIIWTSLFLGFHNRGLYVHNDVMLDFGTPEKQIWIETSICSMDTIGSGDFLVHHAISLGLHTTTLILVKGALDVRGSKLMPDKKDFGYSFLCDGPGRGGNCDILTWDAFYLAVYWMLNKYYCMIYFFLALETHHIMASELIETLAWAHERTPLANLI
ncbi:hypothetical protein OROMI_034120 [Orobanche minor]